MHKLQVILPPKNIIHYNLLYYELQLQNPAKPCFERAAVDDQTTKKNGTYETGTRFLPTTKQSEQS